MQQFFINLITSGTILVISAFIAWANAVFALGFYGGLIGTVITAAIIGIWFLIALYALGILFRFLKNPIWSHNKY